MSVTVKSVLGDDIRRFVVSNTCSFEDFASQIRQAYNLENTRFSVRFVDDEDELITVSTDAGLKEALSLAVSGFVKILKFQVNLLADKPASDTKAPPESKPPPEVKPLSPAPEIKPASAPSQPKSAQTPRSADAKPAPTLQASAAPFTSTRPVSAPTPAPLPSAPSREASAPQAAREAPSKVEVIRLLRALVMDNEVAAVLPSALQVLQSSLMHPTSSLQHVCDHVLGAFPSIKNHPSIVTLLPWLPQFLPRLEPWRQSLCHMAANLPNILQMIEANSMNFSSVFGVHNPWEDQAEQDGEDEDAQFERDSVSSASAYPHGPPAWSRANSSSGPTDVHHGVTCDNCGMSPIQGVRWKCNVCPNFDLCANCEAQDCHTREHPMIKTRTPGAFMPPPPGLPPHPPFPGFAPPFGQPFGPGHWPGMPFAHPFERRGGRKCGRGRWPWSASERSKCWRAAQPLQATFVRECNLQDRTEVSPSQTLVKTWELQNSGALPWPPGTKLTYARGDLPSIENSFDVAGPVEPGKTVQVSAVVRTPSSPGRYRAFFKMEDNQSNKFGPRLWCDVTVVAANSVPQVPPDAEEPQPEAPQEVKEAGNKAEVARAFWEKEEAREAREKAEQQRKEAEECVVVHAPKEEDQAPPAPGSSQYRAQLDQLRSLGYEDEALMIYLLNQHNGNVENVVSWLLEQAESRQ